MTTNNLDKTTLSSVEASALSAPVSKEASGILSRGNFTIRPAISTASPSDVSHIDFRHEVGWIMSLQHLTLEFQADTTSSGGGGTYDRFPNYIWNIIDRMELIHSGVVLWNIQNFGIWMSQEYALRTDLNSDIQGSVFFGSGTQIQRNTWGTANKLYKVPFSLFLHNPALEVSNVFPLPLFPEGLQLRVYWKSALTSIETDFTTGNYAITNLQVRGDNIVPSSAQIQKYREMIRTGNFRINAVNVSMLQNTLALGSTSYDVTINAKRKNLRKLSHVFQTQANQTGLTVNDKNLLWVNNGLSTYNYLDQGGSQIYRENVRCLAQFIPEAFQELLSLDESQYFYELPFKQRSLFTETNWLGNSCLFGKNFLRSPIDPDTISGVLFDQLTLQIVLSGALATASSLITFVTSDAIVTANSSGLLRVEV